ncbi:MAG: hypothetical protein R6V04_08000 [bacterium]
MKKLILFFLILLLYNQSLICGSVLSSRGLGMDFEHPNTRAQGMGYFAIANIDPYTISKINPASLFIHKATHISASYFNENNFYEDQLHGDAFSQYSNFDGFNIVIPLHKNFGISSGLTPLTRIDYKISFDNSIDLFEYTKSIYGSGGLNSFDLSCYWSYKNRFSIGITGRYIFGNINKTWRVNYDNTTFVQTKYSFSTKNDGFNYKLGIIVQPLSSITIGAVYSPTVRINNNTSQDMAIKLKDEATTTTLKTHKGSISYPGSYGVGVSYKIKKIGLFGIDYSLSEWESLLINDQKPTYVNNINKFSFGFESISSNNPNTSYLKQIRYRTGLCHMSSLSLDPEGNEILESWISLGLGLPLKGRIAEINLAVNYGKRGSLQKNGLSENLLRVSLSLSIGEKWFQREY